MIGRFAGLALGLAFLVSLVSSASADDPIAETARQWGLLGPWSVDCALPPDHANGTVLAYEIGPDGSVVYRRDFGDVRDENQVLAADVSADGMMNLEVYFPAIRQKREVGLMRQPDGGLRAIYNRSEKGEYTIKDGKFVATKKPTPAQYKCEPRVNPNPAQSRG
ncbi:MAG TPA: hypothetical protein VKY22_14260 [Bradyrhizobium sp.]|nr:hypothetical protein [Bradyrhizobium sp.]